MRKLTLIAASFFCCFTQAQTLPVSIANYKNQAKGAYSIIHDDYGNSGVDGIWQYADTIAFNRGLKFTFGAISSDCEVNRNINGYASPYAYAKDVMMAQHNHEIINHSHTHTCAVNRGWSPCETTGWGQTVGGAVWNTELNTSHNSIKNNTGFQPRYYIFPYDQFTDAANTQLASMGYLGSRTGWSVDGIHSYFYKNGYEANDENLFKSDANGFFRTSVQVFDDVDAVKTVTAQASELNKVVNDAITNSQWGNRELHNVGSTGWGTVSVSAYRQHLNYVQTKVKSGDLWMPTVSEMLTYQIQKLVYKPAASYSGVGNKITVNFTEDKSIVTANVGTYLSSLTIKSPVSIVIDVTGYTGLFDFNKAVVKQGSTTITDVVFKNNQFIVNLYPSNGSFTIEENIVTSNENIYTAEEVELYPNPSSSSLNIKGNFKSAQIFNSTGNLLFETTDKTVDVSQFAPGVYFVQIDNSLLIKRFIKL